MTADLPTDHPDIPTEKIGVLLANLGTPDGTDYWSMRRYLNEFLSDRRVIDYPAWKWQPILQTIILTKRPFTSGAAYKTIWNEDADESPLMTITRDQTAKVRETLKNRFGDRVIVDFAMRYGNPSTRSKVRALVEAGCSRILFFPLYPQYAGATTATANDAFFRALGQEKWQPAARTVPPYFDRLSYIDALAQSVERSYAAAETKPDILVASYHGVPERYLMEGDPYHCQCHKTTRLVAQELGLAEDDYLTTFQSRFGREEWLRPYTDDTLRELAGSGVRSVQVVCPGFSADCLETIEEIGVENRDYFLEAGGERYGYVPCLNDSAAHIELLTGLISERIDPWLASPVESGTDVAERAQALKSRPAA